MIMSEQEKDWQAALPEGLSFGEFSEDFLIDGVHCQYRYGAWNTDGDWVLAWNTDEEFAEQLAAREMDLDA